MTHLSLQRGRGVLGTNTVIMLSRITDATTLPQEPLITAVTLARLSVGPLVASTDAERAARQAHLQQVEADFDPLPFDAQAARAFGRVAASLPRAGRKVNARTYDAMIAATALAKGLPVYSCSPSDFAGIEGLENESPGKLAREPGRASFQSRISVCRIRASALVPSSRC